MVLLEVKLLAWVGVVGDMTLDCEVDCDLLRVVPMLVRGDVSDEPGRRSRLLVGEPTLTSLDKKLGAIHEPEFSRRASHTPSFDPVYYFINNYYGESHLFLIPL